MTMPSDFMRRAEQALAGARLLMETGDLVGASNRAYYAMFDAARAALTSVRPDLGTGIKTHPGLIGAFGEHVVLHGHVDTALGRSFNQVEKLRLMADYIGDPLTPDDARWAVAEAERFSSRSNVAFRPFDKRLGHRTGLSDPSVSIERSAPFDRRVQKNLD